MTINFKPYGRGHYTPPSGDTISSITIVHAFNDSDDSESNVEDIAYDIASVRDSLEEETALTRQSHKIIGEELRRLENGLNVLESAGNHNTKIASDEFKKIEVALERGYDRIRALENAGINTLSACAVEFRVNKLEQTALTRDEVKEFVNTTCERLQLLEKGLSSIGGLSSFFDRAEKIDDLKKSVSTRFDCLEKKIKEVSLINQALVYRIEKLEQQASIGNLGGDNNPSRYSPGRNFSGNRC